MILYFDNYITDAPLYSGGHQGVNELRKSCKNYNMPSKLDITLYSLSSYSVINWSHVVIKYELENLNQKKRFETFVKKLFPKAIIIY
ncbi:MAG: hypothetical protein Q8P81_00540, partial [Nanoarchaeota archaeon]|nr:hypothetical protein [Nanoarchaeota archaeon]